MHSNIVWLSMVIISPEIKHAGRQMVLGFQELKKGGTNVYSVTCAYMYMYMYTSLLVFLCVRLWPIYLVCVV